MRARIRNHYRLPVLAAFAVLALTLWLGGSTMGPARAIAVNGVAPSERQREVARKFADLLQARHYRQTVLDDRISAQVFDFYLEALDPARSYPSLDFTTGTQAGCRQPFLQPFSHE